MIKLETIVFSNMVNGITSKELNKIVLVDKYDLISAVRRLVYFDKKLSIKTNDEINQLTKLFIKKK